MSMLQTSCPIFSLERSELACFFLSLDAWNTDVVQADKVAIAKKEKLLSLNRAEAEENLAENLSRGRAEAERLLSLRSKP